MKRVIFLCLAGWLMLGINSTPAQQSTSTTTTTTTTTYVPTTTVVGARVLGPQGDEIGQINDIVLDKQSGCMAYAVLATDQGGTRKLVAAPWTLFSAGTDNRTYTVTVDREKIYAAPVWESNRIDEYSRAEWLGNVYSYYGVQPQPGLNIHASVGVNTDRRQETDVDTRNQQRVRAHVRTQEHQEEGSTSSRNADTLSQPPSPGRHTARSAASHDERTATDEQSQQPKLRERGAQREAGATGEMNSSADQTRPNPAEKRAERRESRTEGAAQPDNAPERAEQSQSRTEQATPPGGNRNRPETSPGAGRNEPNAQQRNPTEGKASSRSRQDQREQPTTEASPTP